jgi:2'-5' RNA ligase
MDLAQYRARVIDSYALVSYVPNPLGGFLDELSRALIPGCRTHAHITLLPPRHLNGTEEEAKEALAVQCRTISPFELQITDIEIFDITAVIYANIGLGRTRLLDIHKQLNTGALEFQEQFAYHPHITLAIDMDHRDIHVLAERARRMWHEYGDSRRFVVDSLHFVHNVGLKDWDEVAVYDLVGAAHAQPER